MVGVRVPLRVVSVHAGGPCARGYRVLQGQAASRAPRFSGVRLLGHWTLLVTCGQAGHSNLSHVGAYWRALLTIRQTAQHSLCACVVHAQDPKAVKPEDWDEREKIPDPEDKKPEGWDDIPATIVDPDAKKPGGCEGHSSHWQYSASQ